MESDDTNSLFSGWGGLTLNDLVELYSDASAQPSSNTSPTSSTSPMRSTSLITSSLTSPTSPESPISSLQWPPSSLQRQKPLQESMGAGIFSAGAVLTSTPLPSPSLPHASYSQLQQQESYYQRFCQQQQKRAEQYQQQQRLSALAQQPLPLVSATAPGQREQADVSKSLQMFAAKLAVGQMETPRTPSNSLDAIMLDFENNGRTRDIIAPPSQGFGTQFANNNNNNWNLNINSNININPQLQLQQQQNLKQDSYNPYQQENIWQMMPSEMASFQAALTTNSASASASAAAISAHQAANSNLLDANKIYKKPQKRPNFAKYDKQGSLCPTKHCVFCENNHEVEAVVKSHSVRDSLGRVLCPKLRVYICPICKASGDSAHTLKYCPKRPIITMEDAIRAQHLHLARNNSTQQKLQMKYD